MFIIFLMKLQMNALIIILQLQYLQPFQQLFIKNKKNFDDYKKFIEFIYKKEYIYFDDFVCDIINYFIEWNALIFLDQYSQDLFNDNFINILKQEKSKLKVLLINSMNDKWIRSIYVYSILNFFNKTIAVEDMNLIKEVFVKLTGLFY